MIFLWYIFIIFYFLICSAFDTNELNSNFPIFKCSNFLESLCRLKTVWVATNSYKSHIHRFFDSSPFSPSGRYLAVSRFDNGSELKSKISIIVIDLLKGQEIEISTTHAWGSQLGAHIQWGGSDNQLLFNAIRKSNSNNSSSKNDSYSDKNVIETPYGVNYNIFTKESKELECPIYHVSNSGRFAASPCMTKLHHMQIGYGITVNGILAEENLNVSSNQGLFITDLSTGKCKLLVSLERMAKIIGIPLETPVYGFHVKWSSDEKYLLFVVRHEWMVESSTTSTFTKYSNWLGRKKNTSRVNHLVVVSADGLNVGLLHTWSSRVNTWNGESIGDGNHPNWVPNSCLVSMNTRMPLNTNSANSGSNGNLDGRRARVSSGIWWDLTLFNACSFMESNGTRNTKEKVYKYSSGHPLVGPNARNALLDTSPKEIRWFAPSPVVDKGAAPLRLLDLDTHTSKTILAIPVDKNLKNNEYWNSLVQQKQSSFLHGSPKSRVLSSWRCDVHPAWNRDFTWVALNTRNKNGNRQVLIAYIGNYLT